MAEVYSKACRIFFRVFNTPFGANALLYISCPVYVPNTSIWRTISTQMYLIATTGKY